MPLTVLASVSLLALVVTGRPIPDPGPRLYVSSVWQWIPASSLLPRSVEASGKVHNAVQAIIESRLGYVRRFQYRLTTVSNDRRCHFPFVPSH